MVQRKKILIVDDTELNRALLSDMLSPAYDTIEVASGVEAVALLSRQAAEIALVLLDIVMPEMDGFEVLAVMNRNNWIQSVPVIMISAEASSSYVDHAYDLGATDYITRPFDEKTVLRRVQNTIMLYTKQQYLEDLVTEQVMEKERINTQMVEILSNIVEFRNGESGLHVLHIRILTNFLLQSVQRRCPQYELTVPRIALIANASALHDIGKISIDEKILNKPGRLTPEEYEIMKTHTVIGAQVLENTLQQYQESDLMREARNICRWHHERYDGRGYPDGLKGEEIPISAQVVALADVYDALTSKRVYKPAHSHAKAVEMIQNGECGAFNPMLLECLNENAARLEQELKINSLNAVNNLEMQRVASEIISRGELQISSRTLMLLEQERAKYDFFASMTKEILFEYDCGTEVLEFSAWGAEYLGIQQLVVRPTENEQILSWDGKSMEDMRALLQRATPSSPIVSRKYCLHLNEKPHWFHVVIRTLWDSEDQPKFSRLIGKLIDIHEDQTQMTELRRHAKKDALTGLYNQAATQELVQKCLDLREDSPCLMIELDLDAFHTVNETRGSAYGDSVLNRVAQDIQSGIRHGDVAGRIGGDEFLIFMEYRDDPESLVRRVFETVTRRVEEFAISASAGVALCPRDGTDFHALFHCAGAALASAKQAGKRQYQYYKATD